MMVERDEPRGTSELDLVEGRRSKRRWHHSSALKFTGLLWQPKLLTSSLYAISMKGLSEIGADLSLKVHEDLGLDPVNTTQTDKLTYALLCRSTVS
jgi:hypothetical protein